ERKKLSRLKKTPAITQDGEPITLLANIEPPNDAANAFEAGAMGIGLFRSEFLFMGRAGHLEKFPSEDEQFESYKQAVIAMKGRVVTIRTLDVG
ncbi:putative PEP-binding protein, partial [Salmonella enterica]|uniref:putative PEP-binding protein n=1 Tax=Salmonella enterica TaxID=28901 RepID=UPI003CF492B5